MTDFALSSDAPPPAVGLSLASNRSAVTKHEWLTPPHVIAALGAFDLDPCAVLASRRPWPTAAAHFDANDNGLLRPWTGRVWLNPPYETDVCGAFLARLLEHGNGIALIFARTETDNWHRYIWGKASAVLFLRGRLTFCHHDGTPADFNSGAPSALIAYGAENVRCLREVSAAQLPGAFIDLTPPWAQTCPNCDRPAPGGLFGHNVGECGSITHCGCYHSPRGGERHTADRDA